MNYPLQLQTVTIHHHEIVIYVPQLQHVQATYYAQKQNDADAPFPYWAKIWPASIAMADFLLQHHHYIQNKNVLELAAGLGLPSVVASKYADKITVSDYLPEAVATIQQTIEHNQIKNATAVLLNWYHLPEEINADVLLLSDINYEPAAFDALHLLIQKFIGKGATIILSTPQRLMAKSFIDQLLPWCVLQQQIDVELDNAITAVSLLVLKKQ